MRKFKLIKYIEGFVFTSACNCDDNHGKGKLLILSGIFRVESFVFKIDIFFASLWLLVILLTFGR